MLWYMLGVIYGFGVGITFIGSLVYTVVIGAIHTHPPIWKSFMWSFVWPITCGLWAVKLWKVWRDQNGFMDK